MDAALAGAIEDAHQAGPGAHEIRTWMALAGALEGTKGEILAYEPVKAWATGCAVASMAVS